MAGIRGACLAALVVLAACGSGVSGSQTGVAPDPTALALVPATTAPVSDLWTASPPADSTSTADTGSDTTDAVGPGDGNSEADPVRRVATVAVLGDSLTLSATDELSLVLVEMGLDVQVIDAMENRRIAGGSVEPGIDAAQRLIGEGVDADLWVVALGTNDVGAQVERTELANHMARLLANLPPTAEVIWVDTYVGGRLAGTGVFNSLLSTLAAADDRVGVVGWYEAASDTGMLIADQVHLTGEGRARFAELIATAIDQRFEIDSPPRSTQR